MATIALTIPDAALPRVVEALCARGHWNAEIGTPKGVYAKQMLAEWLKAETLAYELRTAKEAAAAAVIPPDPVTIT
jgi:hypothetical protein